MTRTSPFLFICLLVCFVACDMWNPRIAPEIIATGIYNGNTVEFTVRLNQTPLDGDSIRYALYDADGALVTGATSAITGTGDVSFSLVNIDDGFYELFVYVEASGGTRLTPALDLPFGIAVDTTAPSDPQLDPGTGSYDFPIYVSLLDHVEGLTEETVYFTTDGSTPNSSSSEFTSPYIIASNTLLTFVRIDAAGNMSNPAPYTYSSNPKPVVSITTTNPVTSTAAAVALTATTSNASSYLWTIEAGSGGSFAAPTTASTSFTGATGIETVYILRLTATSSSGSSAHDEITVYWDNLDPVVSVGSDIGQTDSKQTISASILESSIASILWESDTGNVTFGNSGAATTTVTGISGAAETHTLTCTVTDAAGNIGSDSLTFNWDDLNPTVSITTGDPVAWTNTATTLTATSTETVNQWEVISGQTGASFTAPTATTTNFTGAAGTEGIYTIRFTGTDAAGNSASDEITVQWDDVNPTVNVGPDIPDTDAQTLVQAIITDASPTSVSWASVPAGAVFSDSTSASTLVSGTTGAATAYTLTCTITDAAGNVGSDSLTFNWDDLAPTVSITTGDPVAWTNTATTLTATSTETVNQWEVISGQTGASFSAPTATTTNFAGAAGTEGIYTIRFTGTDAAGNSASDEITVQWDDVNPTVNVGIDIGPVSSWQAVSASITEGYITSILWTSDTGNVTFGNATAPTTTVAGFSGSAETHVLTCTVTDSAGNIGSDSLTFNWDDQDPTASISPSGSVTWTNTPVTLIATGTGTTHQWSVLSGYAGAVFSDPTATTTDFTGPVDVEDGYWIEYKTTDDAGNTASAKIYIEWDDKAPQLTGPTAITATSSATYAIGPFVDYGSGITDGVSWTVFASTGTYTLSGVNSPVLNVSLGASGDSLTINCTATDVAGNSSTTVQVTVSWP